MTTDDTDDTNEHGSERETLTVRAFPSHPWVSFREMKDDREYEHFRAPAPESGTWLGVASCAVAVGVIAAFLWISNLRIEASVAERLSFGASLTSPSSPAYLAGVVAALVAGAALAVAGLRRQRAGWSGLCVLGLVLNVAFALVLALFYVTGTRQE